MLERLVEQLRALDVTDVAVHLPDVACAADVADACVRAGKRVVALDPQARVVVTADGVESEGVVRCLKDEVDAVATRAHLVFVVRLVGDAPLAATMDAYLDVAMTPGRDIWVDAAR